MEKDSENQLESMMEDDRDSEGAETVAPPGGSAERPLRVKFKFPNMKESAEEDMEDDTQVKSHYCVVCKKRFSSGKALGGHMSSAHVQANRDFSLKKLKYKMKRQQKKLLGFPSGYGGINTCKICGKEFPTIKSLFGHMRCHPDRDWRGMEPPAEAAIDFPATTDPEFEAMNGVPSHVYGGDKIDSGPVVASAVGPKGPLRWLVRAKRGRLPIKSVIDSSPLPSSEEILAVQQLVRLVNGDTRKPNEDLESKVKEGEATSSNSWTPRNEIDHVNQDFRLNKNKKEIFPVGDERDSPVKNLEICERADENPGGAQVRRMVYKGKGKAKLDPGFDTENSKSSDSSSEEFDDPNESNTNRHTIIKKKTKVEKKSPPDFSPDGPAAVTPDKYICSTCNKSFPTPQALGGHRSSHKKFKVRVYNTIEHDQSSNGAASYVKDWPKANAIKQLEVNNALGLQNQCHCTGECNHTDQVLTSRDETKKERKVLKFDLNELPDQDDEDGMDSGNTAR